ncbi:TPA: hypothetical protein ACHUSU_003074 [Shigella sonnei]|uniref:hypothetical protein n=2 Tax=Shigella sonnei TaxID=624 RepID=UPI000258D20D|nr:hypothetical protein [Shigella sonnei]MCW3746431.1 hypothetical protein [Shigella sonnei]CSE34626.1 Uncharacterised protein [Shigella sonnei]CSE45157.1 Uncharacterised protein [Shigella sonnei]CSN49562.1 Uncharacterised protein [Shigella sonnei]CSN70344.1 Uncharacterised protein [Shigella sonnei]
MVNKRGLSPEEYFSLDPDVLNMLMIYDTFIEPSGTQIEMMKHAYQCYYTTISNGNLTPEARKSIKVQDFDFLDVLSDSTKSTSEKAEERKLKTKEAQSNDIKSIGELIKSQVLGKKKNGK